MRGDWLCDTPQGVFRITRTRLAQNECYVVLLDDDLLGTCESAEQGLKLLTEERAFKVACGLDIARLPIPRTLTGWTFAPAAS
ncbi:hypothetical protein [Methylobacterium sp.]|jgi:hypothetical protein|uniref:hypothetical protein n=1 Tax=Methylobacterium sp. TaxID=409 RepID=UPI0026119C4C|nr:hypothetical protein [Methylobacterium sp.]MDB5645836.1 hypothetical protein [Methylobacterium sp.]